VLIFVVTAPVFALVVPAIRDRISELASGNEYSGWVTQLNSYAWRELLWEKALSYIWQNPIFGYGLESFHFYSPFFFPLEPEGTHAHNVYIQVLFESGLIGLIAFIWLFWRLFSWLLRYSRVDTRSVMMAAALIGVYIVACYSDNLLEYLSVNWCFWFTSAAILWRIAQSPSRVSGLGRRQRFGSKPGVVRPVVIGVRAAGQLPQTEL
jgi:O-antigen ligase